MISFTARGEFSEQLVLATAFISNISVVSVRERSVQKAFLKESDLHFTKMYHSWCLSVLSSQAEISS